MNDIGLLPIKNRIAEASLAAHRSRKGVTAIREQIVEAIEPMVEELVLIGVERAIIAVDDCAKALRRNVRKAKGTTEHEAYATRLAFVSHFVICLALVCISNARAHDFWSNGDPVPAWVKSYCCGPQDVHHLSAGAVHIQADGYHIDGLKTIVPIARALPSPDGTYWAFWSPAGEPDPYIFCFFAPLNGV